MLDKLPAEVRHAIIALAAALIGWATTALPMLNLPAPLAAIAGAVITIGTIYLTPLTKQYGVSFVAGKPVKKTAAKKTTAKKK